ncbi:hypothetical protein [Nocardia asteroides]|uniref:hypothetical protein n=1 Tax=Nocardia asteroides TaxID=1824 RepID=UPI0033DB6480
MASLLVLALPFVVLYFAAKYGYPPTKRFYTHPDQATRLRRRRGTGFALSGFFGLATIANLGQTHFAQAAVSCVLVVAGLTWAAMEARNLRDVMARELSARAEARNRAYLDTFNWERPRRVE